MINGAIKRALQVAKMRNGQTQSATIPPRPQAPVPRQKDMPVDPTRSKSSQERNKFKDGGVPTPPSRPVEFAGEDAARAFPGIWKNVNPIVKYNMGRQPGYAETYPPRETGDPKNPRSIRPKEFGPAGPRGRTGIEVYRPEMKGSDLALELLHADPRAIDTRNRLLPTMSEEQRQRLREREDYRYSIEEKLPEKKAYENAMDAANRSYLANKRDLPHNQGPSDLPLTPEQQRELDALYGYMMTGKADGGSVDEESRKKFLKEQLKGSAPQYDPEGGMETAKEAGRFVAGLTTPGAIADAAGYLGGPSALENIRQGNYGTAALQAAGAIPLVGPLAKGALGAGLLYKALKASAPEVRAMMNPSIVRSVGGGDKTVEDTIQQALRISRGERGAIAKRLRPLENEDAKMAVLHSLRPSRVNDMLRYGWKGLPSPSLAIAKPDSGLDELANFGSVHLVGKQPLAHPSETNPIVANDMWSPRVPEINAKWTRDNTLNASFKTRDPNTGEEILMPATPENIVTHMKRRPLIGGEGGDLSESGPHYRVVKSQLSPRFKTFEEVKQARDKLAGEPDVDLGYYYSTNNLSHAQLAEQLYKYAHPQMLSQPTAAAFEGASFFKPPPVDPANDLLLRAMADRAETGGKNWNAHYKDVPDDLMQRYMQYEQDIADEPVNYFEAKPQRVVNFNEFAGALIPKKPAHSWDAAESYTPAEMENELRKLGIANVQHFDDEADYGLRNAIHRYFKEHLFHDGGEVNGHNPMSNDKVQHALDIALSASHPKRFHHTLARTGYAEGGIPDIEGPADLAKEVPYTHDKMMASQFDVAKAQPYKAPKIALGPVGIKLPKKSMTRAPRSDIGKMRVRKIRALKPKKLKFAGGGAAIEDALNLAKRLMKDVPDHGAAFQQGATSTVVKEKLPGKKAEVLYEHHERTPPQGAVFKRGGRGNG